MGAAHERNGKPRTRKHPHRTGSSFAARLLLLGVLSICACAARAEAIRVAVAANFALPMQKIVAEFEKSTGQKVQVSVGSTGKFYAQIKNGAPYEILLAADQETPARLVQEGEAVGATRFTYAIGRLVLWSPMPDLVDAEGAVLRKGSFRHLSIANPELAPYGAAAVQVMRSLGLYDALQPKLVKGENISQAYQFVASGAAEVGFVALSQVLKGGSIGGSAWVVPDRLHAPIRQDAVMLQQGNGKPGVQSLLAYLRSDAARAIIMVSGYRY
jgi:molybdate transport system substrate-binding protein